jgi:hypothetical protein
VTTEQSTVQAATEQAKEQAQNIAHTATQQTRNVVSDVTDEVSAQVSAQKARLAASIRDIGDELEQTAQNGNGTVANLAGEAADRTRQISSWIDTHEPRDVLAEIEDFARQRPVVFVLGAATLGFLVGRVTRSAVSAARDNSSQPSNTIDLREANLPGMPVMEPEGASMQPAYGIPIEPHLTGQPTDLLAEDTGPLQQRAHDEQSAYPNSDQPVETGDVLPSTGTSIGQVRRDHS